MIGWLTEQHIHTAGSLTHYVVNTQRVQDRQVATAAENLQATSFLCNTFIPLIKGKCYCINVHTYISISVSH